MGEFNPELSSGHYVYNTRSTRDLMDSIRTNEEERKKAEDEKIARLEKAYEDQLKKKDDEVEKAVKEVDKDAQVTISRENEASKSELQRLKNTYDRRGQIEAQGTEVKTLREQIDRQDKALELRSQLDDEKIDALQEEMRERLHDVKVRSEDKARRLDESHSDERAILADEIKDLSAENKRTEHRNAEARAQMIRENENKYRAELQNVVDSDARELDHAKEGAHEVDFYYDRLNKRNLREQEAKYSDLLHDQRVQSHNDQQRIVNEHAQQIEDLKRLRDTEVKRTDEAIEHQREAMLTQREQALAEQASSYDDQIRRQREDLGDKIHTLEVELGRSRDPSSSTPIPAFFEDQIRKSVVKEYEKNFNAERDRNDRALTEINREHAEKVQDIVDEKDHNTATLLQRKEEESSSDRAEFVSHSFEIEASKRDAINEKDSEMERQSDNMTRNYGLSLEKQRREYENVIENIRADLTAKYQALRQDNELNLKQISRANQTRHNELVREYEKRLADQKNGYEDKLDEVKSRSQNDLRESERRTKTALEDQARAYESRIAQLEAQNQERERFLSDQYQDELDKVRRANALAAQKKG